MAARAGLVERVEDAAPAVPSRGLLALPDCKRVALVIVLACGLLPLLEHESVALVVAEVGWAEQLEYAALAVHLRGLLG